MRARMRLREVVISANATPLILSFKSSHSDALARTAQSSRELELSRAGDLDSHELVIATRIVIARNDRASC